jgi:hypothetical protein
LALAPILDHLTFGLGDERDEFAEAIETRRWPELGYVDEVIAAVTKPQLSAIAELLRQWSKETEAGLYPPDRERGFHHLVVRVVGNGLASRLLDLLWEARKRAHDAGAIREPHDLMANLVLHERIFDALRKRDHSELRTAITHHYDFVSAEVRRDAREMTRNNERLNEQIKADGKRQKRGPASRAITLVGSGIIRAAGRCGKPACEASVGRVSRVRRRVLSKQIRPGGARFHSVLEAAARASASRIDATEDLLVPNVENGIRLERSLEIPRPSFGGINAPARPLLDQFEPSGRRHSERKEEIRGARGLFDIWTGKLSAHKFPCDHDGSGACDFFVELSGRQGFASPSSCLAICGDESAKATDLDRAATKFRQRFDQIDLFGVPKPWRRRVGGEEQEYCVISNQVCHRFRSDRQRLVESLDESRAGPSDAREIGKQSQAGRESARGFGIPLLGPDPRAKTICNPRDIVPLFPK